MPTKPRVFDNRSDFSGGLNTADAADEVNKNELLDATNVRIAASYRAIAKRSGSRKMHETAIGGGADVIGVYQWDAPAGKEIVAIAGGKLYHKTTEFGAFTEVAVPATFPTGATAFVTFAPFRSTSAGAALVLYIAASNGNVYSWDGTTLTEIDGTNSVPTASLLAPYNTRLFANKINQKKHAFWSVIGDAADFTVGDASQGGSAIVDTLTGEEIVAMGVVGGSLVFATGDSLARFTGYSNDDVVLAEGTKGISAQHGVAGAKALRQMEDFLVGLAERGPYLISESGIQFIGRKVEPEFDGFNRSILGQSAVIYHRGRREVWVSGRRAGVDSDVKSIYCWSSRVQNWVGPWVYPFAIRDLARYEDANGDEWVIAGAGDGFVYHMDTGAKDGVLFDASGGTNITMTAEVAPTFFEVGPGIRKQLDRMQLQASLDASSDLRVEVNVDEAGWVEVADVTGLGGSILSYPLSFLQSATQGFRFRVRFKDASAYIPVINGYVLMGYSMLRVE
jgi:hypothetical protein